MDHQEEINQGQDEEVNIQDLIQGQEGNEEISEINPEDFGLPKDGEDVEDDDDDNCDIEDEIDENEEENPDVEKVGHVFLPDNFSERILSVIPHNDQPILAVDVVGERILYGGMDDKFTIIDNESQFLQFEQKFDETVTLIALSNVSDLVAVATLDNKITVIDHKTLKIVHTIEVEEAAEEITDMRFHSKGDMLLAGFKDGSIHMWSLPKGKEVAIFFGHIDEVSQCQFTLDGKSVISSSIDATIRLWNPKTQSEKLKINQHPFHTDGVVCFILHPDESKKLVLSGSMDHTVCLSSYETGKTFNRTEKFDAPVNAVSIAAQWNVFMVSTLDGWLKTFDLDSFKELSSFKEDEGIIQLQYEPNLKYFVASTVDGQIVLHTYGQSGVLEKMKLHDGEIHQFKIVGEKIYTCGEDGRVAISQLPTVN